MSISLLGTNYNNFKEIPYLNGGVDVSSTYITELNALENQIKLSGKYLDSTGIQHELQDYYSKEYSVPELNELEDYIAKSFVENEKLSKEDLKNKLNYAIKTENIHKNIVNNNTYNNALQKMVEEDIELDEADIDKVKQMLHNKTRNLEIRQYYDEKMKMQIGIVKTVIIIFLILLTLTMLYKMNILNTHLYIALIGIGLACIVIFTVGRLIDILMRDNMKFDEYSYIRSHHYLNKGDSDYKSLNDDDIPLHQKNDLISDKCLKVMNE